MHINIFVLNLLLIMDVDVVTNASFKVIYLQLCTELLCAILYVK